MQPIADRDIVLIVDDVPDNLAVFSDALDGAGYMVLVAEDGQSALERLQWITPDIILLDAVMPGIDGFETCRRLKCSDETRHVPVVFMTGLTETEHVVRGFMAGGIDYVTKPIRPEEVLARIAAHLQNSRLVMQAHEAIDAVGLAVAVINRDGHCLWLTRMARDRLQSFFPSAAEAGAQLPDRLRDWARANMALESVPGRDSTPFMLEAMEAHLEVHFLGGMSGGQYLLLMETQRGDNLAESLISSYHLTMREVEVLTWIAKGKSNRDVGDALGMSPRTVNKHLEHNYILSSASRLGLPRPHWR